MYNKLYYKRIHRAINMPDSIKIIPPVIMLPRKEVVRMGNRYIIYLPVEYNMLWEELKHRGKKVRVYLEIIDE